MIFDDGNSKEVRLSDKRVSFEDGNIKKVSLSYKEVKFGDSERLGRIGRVAARAIAQIRKDI